MKQYNITFNRLLKLIFFSFLSLTLFVGCDDEETGEVSFDEEQIFIGPGEAESNKNTFQIIVRSNTSWELTTDADWLSFNIPKGASGASVVATYEQFKSEGETREAEVVATTADGKGRAVLKVKQLPSAFYLTLDGKEITVEYEGENLEIGIKSNIPNLSNDIADIEVSYANEDESGWVHDVKLEKDKLSLTIDENGPHSNRLAVITISYTDEFGRITESSLKVNQYLKRDPTAAVEISFDDVLNMEIGAVAQNVFVKGVVVADGQSKNFPSNRFTLQDVESNRAIVFEVDGTFGAKRGDYISLWLMGADLESIEEGNHTFNTFKKISSNSVLNKSQDKSLNIPELYMNELTDDILFSLVTLKDVEIAIPFGGLVNYNEFYVTGSGGGSAYPNLVKNYPTCIRDINGNSLYMLTNFEVPYRRESLPKGSGNITGIIVREQNISFADNLGQYSIRHLEKEDINLAKDRTNGFSQVLVEWDMVMPKDMPNGTKHLAPIVGPSDAIFMKNNADRFDQGWIGDGSGQIYFIDGWRGDGHSSATNNTIAKSTANAAHWDTNTWWIIKNISTVGITKPLSIQFETNSVKFNGPRDFVVEWSLDETNWSAVEGGTYICRGQTENNAAAKQAINIPGHANYNFSLPEELLGKSNIFIRLRCTSMVGVDGSTAVAAAATNRISHLSIKYNK